MPKSDSMTPYMRKRRPGQRPTAEERKIAQETFLQVFAVTANVRAACMKAGISRNTVYEWQEKDEQFGFKFRQASEDANDLIRGELFRRGVQGYDKPVVSMGKQVFVEEELPSGKKVYKPLMERMYSDNLLSLLAKARMPEFREKQQFDVNTTNTTKDIQAIHEAIAQALSSYPEARLAVASALAEMEQARGSH